MSFFNPCYLFGIEQTEQLLLYSLYKFDDEDERSIYKTLSDQKLFFSDSVSSLAAYACKKKFPFSDDYVGKARAHSLFTQVIKGIALPIQIALVLIHTVISQTFLALTSLVRGIFLRDQWLLIHAKDHFFSVLVQSVAIPAILVAGLLSPKKAIKLCTLRFHFLEPGREEDANMYLQDFQSKIDRVLAFFWGVVTVPILCTRVVFRSVIKLLHFSIPEVKKVAFMVVSLFFSVVSLGFESIRSLNLCARTPTTVNGFHPGNPSDVYFALNWFFRYHPVIYSKKDVNSLSCFERIGFEEGIDP